MDSPTDNELFLGDVEVHYNEAEARAALFDAAKNDKPGIIEQLHDARLDLDITDDDGKTALALAVENNSMDALCELIGYGAKFQLDEIDGKEVLFYAAKNDEPGVVCPLHHAGLNLDITDDDGKTALALAVENNCMDALCQLIGYGVNFQLDEIDGKEVLFYAAKNDETEMIKKLHDAGLDLDITVDDGKTAMIYASENKSMNALFELIILGAKFKLDEIDGKEVLFHGAKNDKLGVAQRLHREGLDLDITDADGKTAVFYANSYYYMDVLCELIKCGANFDLDEIDGKAALFYAAKNKMDVVLSKLRSGGLDVNITDKDGKTALFYAVREKNNRSMVRALVDAGADVNIIDKDGKTALFYAVDKDAVDVLIEKGKVLLNAKDQYGRTPLFYALEQDSMTAARHLIEKGGNLYLKDKFGVNGFAFLIEKAKKATALPSDVSELFQEQHQLKSLAAAVLDVIYCQVPLLSTKSSSLPERYVVHHQTYILEALTFARTQGFSPGDDKRKTIDKIAFLITEDKVDVPSVLTLLNTLGANPDAADSDGNTALHYATLLPLYGVSQETVIDICKKLKDLGAMFDVKNQQQQSPLLLCLSVDNWEVVKTNNPLYVVRGLIGVCKFLLNNGSSFNETSQNGESAFHLLMKFVHILFNRQGSKQPDVLQELIELLKLVSSKALERGKENIANKTDGQLNTPLHLWASLTLPSPQDYSSHLTQDHSFENILQLIFDILLECGAKLNPRNENEDTPLHLCKTWAAIKLLIDAGANPNDFNSSKRSPLLVAAKEKTYLEKPGCFYPDVADDDPQTFWKSALKGGLDPWTADKYDESVLSILVESEAFKLAKSLVDVACEDNYTKSEAITISLLNALCKDKSIRTNWKANLVQDILKSSESSTSLSKPLRYCCANVIETGVRDVKQENKTDSAVPESLTEGDDDDAPPPKRRRTDESDGKCEAQTDLYQGPVTVHCEIIKLLRWYGAGVEVCEEIAKENSQLTDLLLKPLPDDQIKEFIPWTSVSKKYEDKLAKVARRQEYAMIDHSSIWYHRDYIGGGSYGHVFAGINTKDGREVAIKRIERIRLQRPEDKREIQNLTALADCQQVVRYVSFFEDQHFCYIVLELMEGNLEEYLDESTIDASKATLLCKDVVMGLKFLHEQNILHRDLKPQNILYKTHPKLCLKIADFGLSRRIDSISTTVYGTNAGTRCWIAPEFIMSTRDHSKSSDIFSCGLLLHYIWSRKKHPFFPADFANKGVIQVAYEIESNIMYGKMEGWDHSLSPEGSDLVRKMIESTVKNRPTAEEAIEHPLFWTKEKKIDFLIAVGNQPEFQCPRAKRKSMGPLTIVEKDLENSFGTIVKRGTWNDSGFVRMPAIYAEMNKWRSYDIGSVVELVRFIRNAHLSVSHDTRRLHIRKLLLDDFVFLEFFPALVMEVYKAVTTHGWDQRDEIKYAMNK